MNLHLNLNGLVGSYASATATAAAAPATPSGKPTRPPIIQGHSFWSADSSTGDDHGVHHHHEDAAAAGSSSSSPQRASGSGGGGKKPVPVWSTEIPLELIEAAVEEDGYLAAQQQQQQEQQEQYLANGSSSGRERDGQGRGKDRGRGRSGHHGGGQQQQPQVISGFVPLPQIPPAPGLPRHLEKLILNMRTYPGNPTGSAGNTPGGGPVAAGSSVIGAGQGGQGGRSGGREERRGGRGSRRDRRGFNPVEKVIRASATPPTPTSPTTPTAEDSSATAAAATTDNSAASSSADGSAETSPTISSLPGPSLANGNALPPSISLTPTSTTPAFPLSPSASMPLPHHTQSQSTSQSTLNGLNSTPLADDTVIADDTSVLPVPSHVVLHHLSTSAIRNGVLAVGGTVRYRKKYMTTVYYKPT